MLNGDVKFHNGYKNYLLFGKYLKNFTIFNYKGTVDLMIQFKNEIRIKMGEWSLKQVRDEI